MSHTGPLAVEEHVHGDTVWVAVRARGADWSWLTREEAADLGRHWIEKYGSAAETLRSASD
jgi:ketosteroid isomerase-like protein